MGAKALQEKGKKAKSAAGEVKKVKTPQGEKGGAASRARSAKLKADRKAELTNGLLASWKSIVGRKPINNPNDVAAMEKRIAEYFDECDALQEPATYSGLTLALGYSDRNEVTVHAGNGEPISGPIKQALARIDSTYEKRLFQPGPVGAIFALKCRGWREAQSDEDTAAIVAKLDQVLAGVKSELQR